MTQAMMMPGGRQAGSSALSVLISSLVLKGKAQARSPEASGKGFHIGARPRPAGRQDGGHHGAHDSVTTRAFGRRRSPFGRITCTRWPLQTGCCGIPSCLIFGERTRASINRASHHHSQGAQRERERERGSSGDGSFRSSSTTQAYQAQEHLSSGGSFYLVLVHPQPTRQSTTPL